MSKKPAKISREQIKKIRALTREGKTIAQIHNETKVATHIVRYHFEREKLSQLDNIAGQKALGGELSPEDTRESRDDTYYKKLIDDLMDRNRKLVEFITLH